MALEEKVTDFFYNLNSADPERVLPLLTDDFVGQTNTTTFTRDSFAETYIGLLSALRPRAFNVYDVVEQGQTVTVKVNLMGTHAEPLKLAIFNVSLAPTGKELTTPDATWVFQFRDDKIAHITTQDVPGTGLQDIVRALEGDSPKMV